MTSALVVGLALGLDAACGEPPAAVHPVVWMGRLLGQLEHWAPSRPAARIAYGTCVGVLTPAGWALLALLAERWLPWPMQAIALKPTFAGRALLQAAQHVETALERGDIQTARLGLQALVSRPTGELGSELASAAAIESLAENYVDSWLAPLLAYALGGLPLAYFYRAANTADAMWGYRDARFEHLGKAAARLDDALNFLPARIAAAMLCAIGGRLLDAIRTWQRDGRCTASPNAGQPMSAAAGALGVRLEKLGHYVLNADGRGPGSADIAAARRLIARAMLASAFSVVVMCGAIHQA